MVVPCGKCPFCMATRRSDWSTRLHYEAKKHAVKQFITLTYANPHLTWKNHCPQLVKRDLQLWFKRVRKTGAKIRYYAVGEYGSKTYRPHYHVLLFGDVSESVIRESWPLGQVHIGSVTQESIMYCLKYMVNGKAWQMRKDRQPPFALMSRKPGLGSNYLTDAMISWHRSERKNYTVLDGQRRHLPRYYKTKIFSKIDLVRIAVRDQKDVFKRKVEWLRHPSRRKMSDPLAYQREQMRRAAKRIRAKCKDGLTL
jgi:hypothetical protein